MKRIYTLIIAILVTAFFGLAQQVRAQSCQSSKDLENLPGKLFHKIVRITYQNQTCRQSLS